MSVLHLYLYKKIISFYKAGIAEGSCMKLWRNTAVAESGSVSGSLVSAFCPACIPTIGSFLTAIGLGAFVNLKLLGIATIVFLVVGVIGLYLNSRIHRKWQFLTIGALASLGVFGGRYLFESLPLIYGSAILLIGNAIFDYKNLKRCKKCG